MVTLPLGCNVHEVTLLLDTVPLRVRTELVGELDSARVIAHGVDRVEVFTRGSLKVSTDRTHTHSVCPYSEGMSTSVDVGILLPFGSTALAPMIRDG